MLMTHNEQSHGHSFGCRRFYHSPSPGLGSVLQYFNGTGSHGRILRQCNQNLDVKIS
jgi:hypothetical protein